MEELPTSRIGRPPTGRTGKSTNIYLDPLVKVKARTLAKRRFGQSLSERIESLLRTDIQRDRQLRAKSRKALAAARHMEVGS